MSDSQNELIYIGIPVNRVQRLVSLVEQGIEKIDDDVLALTPEERQAEGYSQEDVEQALQSRSEATEVEQILRKAKECEEGGRQLYSLIHYNFCFDEGHKTYFFYAPEGFDVPEGFFASPLSEYQNSSAAWALIHYLGINFDEEFKDKLIIKKAGGELVSFPSLDELTEG